MPRKPRFNLIGIPQHVIQRGNNREPCFYAEQDFRHYLDDLLSVSDKYDCRIHAYVLMTNHVHLLMTPMVDHGISQLMQALGRRYVYYINKTYKRTGTLWEGRFKSSLIDSNQYLLKGVSRQVRWISTPWARRDRHLQRRRSYAPHLRRYGLVFNSRLGVDYKFLEGGGCSLYRLLKQPVEKHPSCP